MKSIILATSIIFSTSALAVTPPVGTIPSGYTKVEDSTGAAVYKKWGFYAVYVDLNKATIKLGNLDPTGDYNKWGHANYEALNLSQHWNKYANYKTFALINGQFFDHDTDTSKSPIAYPLTSNGNAWQRGVEDSSRKVQSLYQNYDGQWHIANGFSPLNSAKNLIVGFDIDESLGTGDLSILNTIDRTYVGGLSRNCNNCTDIDQLIFLIGNNKSAQSMIDELSRWGVSSNLMIRLDGSDSTQLKTNKIDFDASGDGARNLPHSIEVTKF